MENKVNILGVNVDKVNIEEAVDAIFKMLDERKSHSIFTPNSEIILNAYKNKDFCDILNNADLLTADGIGVVYASKILGNPIKSRAAGYDIACGLIDRIAETGHRLYLFGGKPGIAEKAKYQLEKALQEYFKKAYGDKISNSRFNVTKIYSAKEEKQEPIKSLKLGKKDVAFEVTYQLQPAEGTDPNELIITDGEYDKDLGWVKNISRLGVLKYNEKTGSYSVENFGTGW